MRTFLFEVNYSAADNFDHKLFIENFKTGISDLYQVKDITISTYEGPLYKTTHTAQIELYANSINHQQLFGQVHITSDFLGIKVTGIPNGKMRFSDE